MKQGLHTDSNGTNWWYKENLLHRIDGPAIVCLDGYQCWYQNDKLHREDGPAIINPDGTQRWFINGNEISETDFQNHLIQINLKTIL